MKNLIIIVSIIFCSVVNAQFNSYSADFSMPRIRDFENFFFSEWELNPSEMPIKFSDIEQLKKEDKNPYLTYQISKYNGITTVQIYANSQRFSEATYKNGLLDGTKTIYHNNGMPFQEIEFKAGKVDGLCKVYNTESRLILETNYKNNQKNGIRKYHIARSDDEFLEGNFVNGNLVGDLKFYVRNNQFYTLPNDLKKGKVNYFFNEKLISEFNIVNEKTHGIAKHFNFKTGKLITQVPYFMGEKNGWQEVYNSQGELLNKNEFKLGKKVGEHKTYSDDKKLTKEEYYDSNGLKIGNWKEYNKNGEIYTEQEYKNDSLNGSSKRYGQGFLQEMSTYKNGKREGLAKYYKSGTSILTSDVYYSNDYFYKEIVYYDSGKTFSIREIEPKTKAVAVKYYNPDETFFHENKFLADNVAIGFHKIVEKVNETIAVRSETLYDGKKNRVNQTYYGYKNDGSYTIYNFRNNTYHGESKSFDAVTNETKIIYYYETNNKYKIVTKEEFEKLTAAEKK